jgi:hypothetical protein
VIYNIRKFGHIQSPTYVCNYQQQYRLWDTTYVCYQQQYRLWDTMYVCNYQQQYRLWDTTYVCNYQQQYRLRDTTATPPFIEPLSLWLIKEFGRGWQHRAARKLKCIQWYLRARCMLFVRSGFKVLIPSRIYNSLESGQNNQFCNRRPGFYSRKSLQ